MAKRRDNELKIGKNKRDKMEEFLRKERIKSAFKFVGWMIVSVFVFVGSVVIMAKIFS